LCQVLRGAWKAPAVGGCISLFFTWFVLYMVSTAPEPDLHNKDLAVQLDTYWQRALAGYVDAAEAPTEEA